MSGPREVLEVVGGPDRGTRFAMVGDRLGIGREPDMDAILSDPRVSRRHAQLVLEDGTLAIEDLGSSSGTAVNGVRVEGSMPLRPGDRVLIGGSELLVLWAPSRTPITEEGPAVGVPPEGPAEAAAFAAPVAEAPTTPIVPPPAPAVRPGPVTAPAPGALTNEQALRLALAAAIGVLGVLVLVMLAPPFLGGQSIAGSDQAGLIAQTVLEGVVLLGLGIAAALGVLGLLPRPGLVEPLLLAGVLLVGGIVLGQAFLAATLSGVDQGAAVWLLLVWGLLAVGAGVASVLLGPRPRPIDAVGAIVAACSAAGGIIAAVGAPLSWLGGGFLTIDGFELGAGKALLAFAIIMVLAAGAPIAQWATQQAALGALVARCLLALGGLLFGFGLTACTAFSDATLKVGVVLALLGGLIAAGTLVAVVVLSELRGDAR